MDNHTKFVNEALSAIKAAPKVYKRMLNQEIYTEDNANIFDSEIREMNAAIDALHINSLQQPEANTAAAAGKRLEEIYYPGDSIPLYLDKRSETLKVIQRLRNEAHRFGLNFHRSKRSKAALSSVLDDIEGIGPKTRIKLIKKFKSFKNIKNATKNEITEIIGVSKATNLIKKIHQTLTNKKTII